MHCDEQTAIKKRVNVGMEGAVLKAEDVNKTENYSDERRMRVIYT